MRKTTQCRHSANVEPDGLALITIGNQLKGEHDIAAALCDILPEADIKDVCRFDLGSYTGFLADCLAGHKAAIIIDSTSNGTAAGTMSIVDLSLALDRAKPPIIQSRHGASLVDELRLTKQAGKLPKRIIFFGVELSDSNGTEPVVAVLKQPLEDTVKKLSLLVSKVLETLKRDNHIA